jgi:hypothetical protein
VNESRRLAGTSKDDRGSIGDQHPFGSQAAGRANSSGPLALRPGTRRVAFVEDEDAAGFVSTEASAAELIAI